MRALGPGLGAALVCGLAVTPLVSQGYHLDLIMVILFWVGLASAWNLMSGLSGYIDFGSAAYVGVGSYVAGLLCANASWPLWAGVAAAGGASALLAIAVGWPGMRLRGAYFAIATFALAEALFQTALEWKEVTEGGLGLTVPVRLSETAYYYVYLAFAVVPVGLTAVIKASRLGHALRALRQDEAAAERLGVNTHGSKLRVYTLSAALIGMLGALDATRLGYFTPADVFDVHITIKMVIMSLLGGLGTVAGPVLGAASLELLEDWLGAGMVNIYLLVIGLIIVAVIMFMPQGILGSRWGAAREAGPP